MSHFRPALAVLCLGVALVLADVGIKMKSMKADKRNPDLAKFTGSCDYGMEDIDFEGNLEPEIVNITVEFDREVQGFKVLFHGTF